MKIHKGVSLICALLISSGCAETVRNTSHPAEEYAARVKNEYAKRDPSYRARLSMTSPLAAAAIAATRVPQVRLASDELPPAPPPPAQLNPIDQSASAQIAPQGRDYTGPLAYGEPGVSSSLWREGQTINLVRDVRAFQPMDLITIVVSEADEGKKQTNTEVKQNSTLLASISSLFGLDDAIAKHNPNINEANTAAAGLNKVVDTDFESHFKGEGNTNRKGSLTGKISAMVAEVLPSGILRIEGEKIVSVDNEDETMVISGLVRPEDVNSSNEVSSGKIANVRIDYGGKGTLGDSQQGGWLGRMLRRLWPI